MTKEFHRYGPGASQNDRAPVDNALKDIWDAILAMPRAENLYGVAMSPQVESHLRSLNYNTSPRIEHVPQTFAGVPYIVDSRLTDKSEVFYDKAAWRDRVEDQVLGQLRYGSYKAQAGGVP